MCANCAAGSAVAVAPPLGRGGLGENVGCAPQLSRIEVMKQIGVFLEHVEFNSEWRWAKPSVGRSGCSGGAPARLQLLLIRHHSWPYSDQYLAPRRV